MQHNLHLSVCFLIALSWISTTEGLECPTCTYLTPDADIPYIVRTVVDGILNFFQEKKCAEALKGRITEINEELCETTPGKIPKCSFYNGSVTLTIPLPIVPDISLPVLIYQRGCYDTKQANVPLDGCYDRDSIDEDKTVIKKILDKASSSFDVVKFTGELCLCEDTYCRETSGVSHVAKLNIVLILFSALIYLI